MSTLKFPILLYFFFCVLLPNLCCIHLLAQSPSELQSVAGNEQVEAVMKSFSALGVQSDGSSPTPPDEAIKLLKPQEGLTIDLIAHEPSVSQPLFLSWDSRGRMWVVQYRQYQFPAGLKIIRYDQYLRAVFDKVPEPPPRGTAGADTITVHSDTDGDGLYDTSKEVLTGLNIATSVQIGHGGIWVLNPPYLLFYPDADGDDVPDSDPEVHLSGFGLQDTHSVANSLLWGPDGWLYGANGSTTAGTISSAVTKAVNFEGQCIWRYHPRSREFEIYAEGCGNTFSLDIDSTGRVFSGTNGGNTRGYYYPQGSYSEKNWGKHGPLTNPYALGFFRAMLLQGDTRRFAQAFVIYEGGLFPKSFDGSIVAPNSLHNVVWHSERIPHGSTYRTEDHANLIESSDRWFRPVYSGVGPDGAIYLADWYDTRLSHVSPIDDWHKESGRIYRVRPNDSQPKYTDGDLSKLSSTELIAKFEHPNKWVRQRAVLELSWRRDLSILDALVAKVDNDASLEALWVIAGLDALSTQRAVDWLGHTSPHIRRWTVRLLGDRREGHAALADLARRETEIQVRSQLASTAKRIDVVSGLATLAELAKHSEDINDPHLPLLCWWSLESHADHWPEIQQLFSDKSFWQFPIVKQFLIGRLIQRNASRGSAEDLQHCQELVQLAPDDSCRDELISHLVKAFQGRALPVLPPTLNDAFVRYQNQRGESGVVLALRSAQPDAAKEAIATLKNTAIDIGVRIEVARTLGEIPYPAAIDTLLQLATGRGVDDPALQRTAIAAVASYNEEKIAKQLVGSFYSSISGEHNLRDTACRTLASRPNWALTLLAEINNWRLKSTAVPADVIQQLRTYDDAQIVAEVEKAFGKPIAMLAPEKLAEINRLSQLLSHSKGNFDDGKTHFMKRCGVCHKLFGEGESIGPPLDGYQRGDIKFWLANIVEPNLEIREGYQSYLAISDDGRSITGMITAQDTNTVTLRTADNRNQVLPRTQLEVLKALPTSLMPEDALKEMSESELRDLFAYLSFGVPLK